MLTSAYLIYSRAINGSIRNKTQNLNSLHPVIDILVQSEISSKTGLLFKVKALRH